MTSANRRALEVPEWACRTDVTLGRSTEHGLGVRCRAIHVAVFGASKFRGLAMLRRMYEWDHFWPKEPGGAGPGDNRSAQFG